MRHLRLVLAATLSASALAQTPTVTRSYDNGGPDLRGIAFDPITDETWVLDVGGAVTRLDPDGAPTGSFQVPAPASVGASWVGGAVEVRSGNLWLASEAADIAEVSPSGTVVRSWSARPYIGAASSLAVDPDFRILLVADPAAAVVQRFFFDGTPAGGPIDAVGAGASHPDGLTCNWLTRTILLAEATGQRILAIDAAGTLLATYTLAHIPDHADGGHVSVSPSGLSIDTATGELLVSSAIDTTIYRVAGVIPAPVGAVIRRGTGCPDSGGTAPRMGLNGLIQINTKYDFVLQASVVPSSPASAYFFVGTSRLDIDLDGLGIPGCGWYATPELGIVGPLPLNANGRAGFGLGLGPPLLGLEVNWQAVVYPDLVPSRVAFSNGVTSVIQ